jgi:hypothetical protein
MVTSDENDNQSDSGIAAACHANKQCNHCITGTVVQHFSHSRVIRLPVILGWGLQWQQQST